MEPRGWKTPPSSCSLERKLEENPKLKQLKPENQCHQCPDEPNAWSAGSRQLEAVPPRFAGFQLNPQAPPHDCPSMYPEQRPFRDSRCAPTLSCSAHHKLIDPDPHRDDPFKYWTQNQPQHQAQAKAEKMQIKPPQRWQADVQMTWRNHRLVVVFEAP